MQLTKFLLVLVLLTAGACGANIFVPPSGSNDSISNFVQDLVNIITFCYGGRIEAISIAGHLPETLLRTLSARHFIPVTLIDNTYKLEDNRKKVPAQFRHPLSIFIVEASSFEQLDSLIQMNIEYSMWWNNMASFFIIDMSPGCVNGHEYLYLAWQRNMLNAKVVCYQHERGKILLNFNPFTVQAPISWQPLKIVPGKPPFTVFSREYGGNRSICVDLDFKKTKEPGYY